MKSPEQVLADVTRRMEDRWVEVVCGATDRWPTDFALGRPTGADLGTRFAGYAADARTWQAWAAARGLVVRTETRRVAGTAQDLPTHLLVPDIDTAAHLVAGPWPQRLAVARDRYSRLAGFEHLDEVDLRTSVRATTGYADLDFDLLLAAADWFAHRPHTEVLTPRQVPVPGTHAKWLNTRQELVRRLAGVESLHLAAPHPARVHVTFLDPAHRSAGGRQHDCLTVGDPVRLPYRPEVVVISENKDTAVWFPELAGGVSIEGEGRGAGAIASLAWLREVPRLFYWGDMDADGLEILNEFRAAGLPVASLLMDADAFDRWHPFGTRYDPKGREIRPRPLRPVEHLCTGERALYERLCSADWDGFRRVEQERIPLDVAAGLVSRD